MPQGVHRTLFGLAIGACVWFAIHGVLAAHKPGGSDFTIYYDAGRAVLEGRNPYEVFGFIYLPFYAVCMAPLSLLPYGAAVIVWQVASLGLVVWIARACVELVRADGLPTPAWLAWAPLVCVLRLADSNFGNGQVNVLTLALLLVAMRAWMSGRERVGGALAGFATALKIVPGCIGLVFLMRGSWRALSAWVLAALACVVAVPAFVTGLAVNVERLQEWWRAEFHPYAAGGRELLAQREYLPGQSLTPVIYRIFSPTPATSLGPAGPSANIADFEPDSMRWIVLSAQALWLAVTLATIARSRRRGGAGARVREVSVVIACALTLAPLVHKAHMVWLIVPYAVLLAETPSTMKQRTARVRWTLVALSAALIGLTTPMLFGRVLATSLLSHNAVFFGLQCVFAAILVDVWCSRTHPSTSATSSATMPASIVP